MLLEAESYFPKGLLQLTENSMRLLKYRLGERYNNRKRKHFGESDLSGKSSGSAHQCIGNELCPEACHCGRPNATAECGKLRGRVERQEGSCTV